MSGKNGSKASRKKVPASLKIPECMKKPILSGFAREGELISVLQALLSRTVGARPGPLLQGREWRQMRRSESRDLRREVKVARKEARMASRRQRSHHHQAVFVGTKSVLKHLQTGKVRWCFFDTEKIPENLLRVVLMATATWNTPLLGIADLSHHLSTPLGHSALMLGLGGVVTTTQPQGERAVVEEIIAVCSHHTSGLPEVPTDIHSQPPADDAAGIPTQQTESVTVFLSQQTDTIADIATHQQEPRNICFSQQTDSTTDSPSLNIDIS